MINILRYNSSHKDDWNNFISTCNNSTFLFNRNFMDYHNHIFNDFSLIFYKKNKIISVIPGNINDSTFYSHQGLTYGGFLFSDSINTETTLHIFEEFENFLKDFGIKKIIYKCIPSIYHSKQIDYDHYCLFRYDYNLTRRDLSFSLNLDFPIKMSRDRRYRTNKSKRNELKIIEGEDFTEFMQIVNGNLLSKYNIKAVHSASELSLLKGSFPENIKLLLVTNKKSTIVGGSVLFIDNNFVHTQYLHVNEDGKKLDAMEFLVDFLINNSLVNKKYLVFGVSTEDNGRFLNKGLSSFKEGFGSDAIVHDFYEKKI